MNSNYKNGKKLSGKTKINVTKDKRVNFITKQSNLKYQTNYCNSIRKREICNY